MRRVSKVWLAVPALCAAVCLPQVASAACTFNPSSGGEPSLQTVFTDMFGAAAPSTTTACLPDGNDGLWHTESSVGSATILVEITGNQSGNTLGIYDSTSTLNSLQIFSGVASAGARAFITVSGTTGNYQVMVDRFDQNGYAGSVSATFATSSFGFYLQQPASYGAERFYSQSFRNAGRNGDSSATDYMYAYQGNGATFRQGSVYAPDIVEGTKFDGSDAILAWEDLRDGSDGDFQDVIVLLRDITPAPAPVPLPAAVWLLGSALTGLGVFGRRRRTNT